MCEFDCADARVRDIFQKSSRLVHAWHSVQPCGALSRKQFHTLALVSRMMHHASYAQGVTVGELAAELRVSPPAVSQNTSALVALGMLARVPDPADRRVARLRPTPQGAQTLSKAMASLLGQLETVLKGEDMDALCAAMDVLTGALEKISATQTTEENAKC